MPDKISSLTKVKVTNSMTFFDQASRALQSGKWEEAEVVCREILAQAPKDFDALHMLAVICSEKGHFDESERLFS